MMAEVDQQANRQACRIQIVEKLGAMCHRRPLQITMRTDVIDAHLAHLKGLTSLQRLHIDSTQITDAGLDDLKELTNL